MGLGTVPGDSQMLPLESCTVTLNPYFVPLESSTATVSSWAVTLISVQLQWIQVMLH